MFAVSVMEPCVLRLGQDAVMIPVLHLTTRKVIEEVRRGL